MDWPVRRSKMGNVRQVYNGHPYQSKLEANYAAELDLRVRAGELKSWERQVRIELVVNGKKICDYTIDFIEHYPNGKKIYIETKGFETNVWRLKWKLFRALFPDWEAKIVK